MGTVEQYLEKGQRHFDWTGTSGHSVPPAPLPYELSHPRFMPFLTANYRPSLCPDGNTSSKHFTTDSRISPVVLSRRHRLHRDPNRVFLIVCLFVCLFVFNRYPIKKPTKTQLTQSKLHYVEKLATVYLAPSPWKFSKTYHKIISNRC